MTKQQTSGGKGMTRTEIAQRAVDSLRLKLTAAEVRLEEAIKHGATTVEKRAAKADKVRARAIKTLIAAGMTEKEAVKAIDKK